MNARSLLFCLMLLAGPFAGPAMSQDKDNEARAKEINAEIAKLRARIVDLEKELAKVLPTKPVDLAPWKFEVGQRGTFHHTDFVPSGRVTRATRIATTFRVTQVVDSNHLVVRSWNTSRPGELFIISKATKGIAEGKVLDLPGTWEVTKTMRHDFRTLYVVEPVKP